MLFSSTIFLFYFLPIVLVLYYLAKWSRPLQNCILLVFSLFFYAWGESKYVFLMIGCILFNYIFGLLIVANNKPGQKKLLLELALAGNLGTLFLFKYLGFFVRNLNASLDVSKQLTVPSIILPIGISFFIFQAMSYVIDVYRGVVEVQKNPFYLGLYVSFFPQLIAGPIVRYATIKDQIISRKETLSKFSVGSCRFIVGLSKKVLLSNSLAVIADHVFSMSQSASVPMTLAWLGIIAYTLQIYYDFSGYSDMAIGLGLMFGFKFEENFNYPYVSTSISEFWRRWHISLGTWFKDYVYFPLGGSRVKNKDKMVRNLLIVWFLTGFWHGAEWTFVLWGLLNVSFIILEKLLSFEQLKIKSWVKHTYCMVIIMIGWVLFRSSDLVAAGHYLRDMLGMGQAGIYSDYTVMFFREYSVVLLLGILFAMPFARRTNSYISQKKKGFIVFELLYPIVMMGLFLLCVCYLIKGAYNPFIYFNF
ncbi:MAG: MBOAT family protein [bacterium]|nr:MBOAT family protein [bacterium]